MAGFRREIVTYQSPVLWPNFDKDCKQDISFGFMSVVTVYNIWLFINRDFQQDIMASCRH